MDSYEKEMLKRRENGMMLSDKQISVLEKHNIDYIKYNNIKGLIFEIETIIQENYDESLEDLDEVSRQLSEISYYNYTNK